MSYVDTIIFVFFIASIVIFLVKIANIMTYNIKPGKRSLKYYDIDISIVLFIVSMLSWFFMIVGFSAEASTVSFFEAYNIPNPEYLQVGIMLSISNIIMILTGVFTLAEIIMIGWANMRTTMDRQRRGFYNR